MLANHALKSSRPPEPEAGEGHFMPGWFSRPLHVSLCITNDCNLSCKHCAPASGQKLSRELDTPSWVALIEHLIESGVFNFTCTGGEPFLSRAMPAIIRTFVKHNRPFSINTNATTVRRDLLSILAEAGHLFGGFTISLDGSSARTHDALRGRGAFAQLLRGLDLIRSMGFPYRFFCVVNQHNKNEVPEIVEAAKRLGAYRIDLNAFGAVGRGCSFVQELNLEPRQQVEVTRLTRRLMKRHHRFVTGFYPDTVKSTQSRERFAKERRARSGADSAKPCTLQACGALRRECTLRPDGTMIPCQSMSGFTIGSLLENSITRIWRNSFEAAYFRSLAGLPVSVSKACEACPYNPLCNGGCRAMAYGATGSLLSTDPFCFYPARDYAPIWSDS
ncbi:MAG: radical SAM protein [Planctomycetota bacterium]